MKLKIKGRRGVGKKRFERREEVGEKRIAYTDGIGLRVVKRRAK